MLVGIQLIIQMYT